MKAEAKLRAIALGDQAVFTDLFRDYLPRFVGYATGLLAGDKEAAEDVVDEAFVVIWQQAGSFDGKGSAEGWMRRIVRNKAIDWCRKQRELPMTNELEAQHAERSGDNDASPFEKAAQSSAARQLREALAILSIEQREAIWLCYFEERSIAEIADIVCCPENTVKTRLFHARKILGNSEILRPIAVV
jgi:RNA polymerase sigma-70 factor, ECF subfamily